MPSLAIQKILSGNQGKQQVGTMLMVNRSISGSCGFMAHLRTIEAMLASVGIHPLAALGVVAVDVMLFGGAVVTAGTGWLISVPVSLVLGIAVTLLQHRGPDRDDIYLAAGKGIVIALLTAIPTPLPSVVTAGSGIAGAVSIVRQRKRRLAD